MKRESTFSRVLDILSDILIIPIVILSLICTAVMFNSKLNYEVPSIFGYSVCRVLTNSMEPQFYGKSGTYQGDVVLIKRVGINELKKGDIIAYYSYDYYSYNNKKSVNAMNLVDYDPSSSESSTAALKELVSTEQTGTDKTAIKTAAKTGTVMLIFHRIVDMKIDTKDGANVLLVQAKGDNANSPYEIFYIHQSMIIGIYAGEETRWVSEAINFCASVQGIIWLVEIPCGIMLLLLSLQLINQIDDYLGDKKRRKVMKAGLLKHKDRLHDGRTAIRKNANFKFRRWYNQYIYFNEADAKVREVRRVRNTKFELSKSIKDLFDNKTIKKSTTEERVFNRINTQNPSNQNDTDKNNTFDSKLDKDESKEDNTQNVNNNSASKLGKLSSLINKINNGDSNNDNKES